jgi:hypothetical protein
MGVGSDFLDILIELRISGLVPIRPAVAEIGAQQLDNSFLEASELLAKVGVCFGVKEQSRLPLPRLTHIVHGDLRHLDAAAPAARLFWSWLGFEYAAIDIDGSPGSIPLDLNYDSIPPLTIGKYHIVTNLGTTEHVANQLNAFKIIHDLTAINGIMIHQLPAQGMFNHGLVNYNFKFFWMLARSNDYQFIYSNYHQGSPYELPSNIVDFIASLNSNLRPSHLYYTGADSSITVVMKKTLNIPFVPPLDVATGTTTNFETLRQRYWTVFNPDELRRVRREQG